MTPGTLVGQIVSYRVCDGFVLSELRYGARHRIPRHAHETGFFCLGLFGSFEEGNAPKSGGHGEGVLGFHPPESDHSFALGVAGFRCFNVELSQPWLDRLRTYHSSPLHPRYNRNPEGTALMLRLMREERNWDESSSPLTSEGLALELLATLIPRLDEKQPPVWIRRVEEILRAEFHRTHEISTLAAQVGVHPAHLSRTFRRFFGQGIGEFQRDLRIAWAQQELAGKEHLTLAEIALRSGFADQAHFSRVFKQRTGVTPGEYRREVRSRR